MTSKKAALLPYGTSNSAPAIILPDTDLFKSERGSLAHNYFQNVLDDIQRQAHALSELAILNDKIYNASYNFVPRVGQIYHLYEKEDGTLLLSMIENWKIFKHLETVEYTADSVWKKIEN